METNEYDVNLNFIMGCEYIKSKSIPDDLKSCAVNLLSLKERYYFLDDLLEKEKLSSEDELLKKYPTVYFIPGSAKKRNDIFAPIVYNIWERYFVQRNDFMYELLFAYMLKHVSIFNIYNFLDHQLITYYNNDVVEFSIFLNISIREFNGSILTDKTIETIKDWINTKSLTDQTGLLKGVDKNIPGNEILDVKWTGSKVDFIKLVYALYDSKFINEGKGDKTKIVKYLAMALNVDYDLKDNDLAVSIKISNDDLKGVLKFFDTIKDSFVEYVDYLNMSKKKRKNKT